jgi:excisionase family DNA binding protein
MESKTKVLNSEEAARILGVNVSSIKRWTDEGKLECIRSLGGHRKFQMDQLADFVNKNKRIASKINVFSIETAAEVDINYHILKGDFNYLRSFLLKKSVQARREEVQNVLRGLYLGQYPLYIIYDRLITPLLHEIGSRWIKNKLSIVEEHIASQIIRDALIRLQGIIRLPGRISGTAVLLNLSAELHDIALKMVQNILETRGFKTFFSGQQTPFLKIEQLLKKIKADRMYISSTFIEDISATQQELNGLFDLCGQLNIAVYVGGSGFDQLSIAHPAVVKRLYNFEEVNNR